MALPVSNTALTSTVQYLINRVNDLANNMTLWTLTTDGNTSSTVPAGNSAITGTFTANNLALGNSTVNVFITGTTSTLAANVVNGNNHNANIILANTSVTVGNSTVNVFVNSTALSISNSSANIYIASPTAVQISNNQFYLNANGSYAIPAGLTSVTNTAGLTLQLIDSWALATSRTADYIVHVEDLNNNNHVSSRLFGMHDNTQGYLTEYATITTNTALGAFSVSTNATTFLLNFTPTVVNTSITFRRALLS